MILLYSNSPHMVLPCDIMILAGPLFVATSVFYTTAIENSAIALITLIVIHASFKFSSEI